MKLLLKNMRIAETAVSDYEVSDVLIENGVISKVATCISCDADRVIDGEGKLFVAPGLVDMHVHFRDPGFTYKEDVLTGAQAAKAGGVTTVCCMPNTKPTIDNAETVSYIINKAKGTGVKVYPVGSITKGLSGKELCDYEELKASGVIAISDDGRPVENAEYMRRALEMSNDNGLCVISHCEDLNIINGGIINKGKVSEKLGVKGMDRASEDYITAREIALAMSCDARIHIAHVSTKGSVNIIRAAKKDGVKVTCETCPHYFTYTDEKLLSRDADYRMSPPLREEDDRIAVEQAVIDGTIDCIVTDHAPHSAEDKADFLTAPNGVVGLETSLAVTLTQLYHTGKLSMSEIINRMAVRPREILGLEGVSVKEGSIADLTVFDADYEWIVEPQKLHSKSKNSVFKGEKLKGRAIYTITDGNIVFELND